MVIYEFFPRQQGWCHRVSLYFPGHTIFPPPLQLLYYLNNSAKIQKTCLKLLYPTLEFSLIWTFLSSTWPKLHGFSCVTVFLKRQCQRIFFIFFSWIEPIWVPDKQSTMVSLKIRFRGDIQKKRGLCAVWYFAKLDSAHCHTAPSGTLRSTTLRHVGKLKCSKNQNCLTLHTVRLRAVGYCGESDLAQCDTVRSLTSHSVSLRQVKQFL